jgi:flagellar hook assembly protein FlgD
VTVQVLDRQNTGVRKLYAGDLPVGSRSFIWDGKTEKEEEVPPGAYFIEVRSGQDVIRHEIHVESTRRIEPF